MGVGRPLGSKNTPKYLPNYSCCLAIDLCDLEKFCPFLLLCERSDKGSFKGCGIDKQVKA